MNEDDDGKGEFSPPTGGDVGDEVANIRAELAQITGELRMHRKVLEQCLEVRENVMELLTHREALTQCLELREGVQAALSSTRLLSEIGDRTAELDLSLAGVSDNTARHGKAISTLTEQQKRNSATLDAVVRAVKRLDRGRNRSRGPSVIRSSVTPGGNSAVGVDFTGSATGVDMDRQQVALDINGMEPALNGNCCCSGGGDPLSWHEEPLDCIGSRGYEACENDAWNWPGLAVEYDEPALVPNEDDPPYCSASSSVGSEGRPWLRRPFQQPWSGLSPSRFGHPVAGRHPSRGRYLGVGPGAPDPSSDCPVDLGTDYRAAPASQENYAYSASCRPARSAPLPGAGINGHPAAPSNGQPSADVADCVKGVLARIEEALTKLDGPHAQDFGAYHSCGSATGGGKGRASAPPRALGNPGRTAAAAAPGVAGHALP